MYLIYFIEFTRKSKFAENSDSADGVGIYILKKE